MAPFYRLKKEISNNPIILIPFRVLYIFVMVLVIIDSHPWP
ncbi:hypothetical protein SAMN02745229_03986 [Butyrivibrio fibrisolvens DSM 3071]|uniref:Uncharacterized protein n=1 Tax=Butyrivibrio fibrisolvens DSM 3071 TaxID=1121131 RepID=A0A1M6FX23_BUTFI|nr:hypothetical protein SAMN02745229_03986 [Butyrivibrio fibrisolvens DSM 3071]